MPIKTIITVQVEHAPTKAFGRELMIERLTGDFSKGSKRDPEREDTYRVTLTGGIRGKQRYEFQHRYGDDLLELVKHAIEAIPGTQR